MDHLICDLVVDYQPSQLGDWTGFPIVKNAKSLKTQIPSQMKGTRNSVKQAVLALRPHQGGSEVLWPLHRLDVLDKHRLIIPTIAANESVNIGPLMSASLREAAKDADMAEPPSIDLWIKPADPCDDEGGVVFRDKTKAEPPAEIQFKMNLAVFEAGAVDCESIIPLAARLIEGVEQIVQGFDRYFD